MKKKNVFENNGPQNYYDFCLYSSRSRSSFYFLRLRCGIHTYPIVSLLLKIALCREERGEYT